MTNVVSLFSISTSILIVVVAWRLQLDEARRKEELEFRMAQLRELYGPLKMQRQRSEANRTLLPNKAPRILKSPYRTSGRWRLVHHIGDIREDSLRLERNKKTTYSEHEILAVRRLMENGDHTAELIVANAGLFEEPLAGAFEKYVQHHEHLRMS